MHSTGTLSSNDLQSLEWRLNGCDGVSNHQPPHCLLLDLVSCGLKKTSNHRGPVNSPHKWPVTRKMFPFDDVIMVTWQWCADARGVSQQWLPGDMSHCPPPKKNKKKNKKNPKKQNNNPPDVTTALLMSYTTEQPSRHPSLRTDDTAHVVVRIADGLG